VPDPAHRRCLVADHDHVEGVDRARLFVDEFGPLNLMRQPVGRRRAPQGRAAWPRATRQQRFGSCLACMDQLNDRDLEKRLAKALHNSGVHAQYVYLLSGKGPRVAIRFLDQAVELARGTVAGPVTLTA
jgi:hypothetical protein